MKKISSFLLKSTIAVAVLSASSVAYAGAISPHILGKFDNLTVIPTDTGGNGELTMMTTSITQTVASADTQAFTSNPDLANAGWGHQGRWYTFHTHMGADYQITANAIGDITPGLTLWKTDGVFDGGTAGTGETNTITGKGVPHAFNQVAEAGDYGLQWATDTSITNGNTANGITELIGYANDGSAYASNGWGGALASDGNADGIATIDFTSMMHSDYVIFVGGADGSDTGGYINLTVSQVPVPAAAYLFGSALIGLFASSRRKLTAV